MCEYMIARKTLTKLYGVEYKSRARRWDLR